VRDDTPTLRIAERTEDDVTILDLAGRLVLDRGDATFRERISDLVARGRTRLIVNMRDVTYIDSAGVGVMVAKMLSVRRAGGDMKLLHLNARSNRVLTITKLLTVFEAFEDEVEAVRSFAAHV
jgi:anti-sigma B factor antagonist